MRAPALATGPAHAELLADVATEPFTGLGFAAAVGLACVACGQDLKGRDGYYGGEPVGLGEGGGRVYACTDGCAELVDEFFDALAELLAAGAIVRLGPDRYAPAAPPAPDTPGIPALPDTRV